MRVIVVAVAVMVFSTLVSVGIEYLRGSRRLVRELEDIQDTSVWPITESMWVSDYQMIATQLEGLIREPYVSYAAVTEGEKVVVSSGRRSARFTVERSYPLVYMYNEQTRDIGRLVVMADRGVVLQDALQLGLIAAIYPVLIIAILGIFLYVVVHRLVVRRIMAISSYLRDFDTTYEPRELTLDAHRRPGDSVDELDEVAAIIDGVRISLNSRHRELEDAYALVSREVEAKTRELQLTNRTLQQQIEDLEAAKAGLTRSDQAKTLFLANVSHELRTPLTGIVGLARLLEQTELDDRQLQYASAIGESSRSLLELVDDLLDFSKLESDRLELNRAAFDPTELVQSVLRLFEPTAERQECELQAEIESDVPVQVVGDSLRIQQVLRNLVSNAIKFTSQGRVTVSVRRAETPDRRRSLRFAVADTGVGIPQQSVERLFESFYQVDSTYAKKQKGTGLGLAISKRLVTMMGGEIGVTSTEGKGSEFSFTVPLEVPEAAEVQGAPADAGTTGAAAGSVAHPPGDGEAQQPPPGGPAGHYRILLAEDNAINRLYLERLLENEGHTVTVAADGLGVLEALKHARVDVILMDIQMPRMDGTETTRHVRKSSDVPIIALTAYARESEAKSFLEIGMNAVVTKPVREHELRRKIAEVLAGR
jgi:signal transduction histidine kinase